MATLQDRIENLTKAVARLGEVVALDVTNPIFRDSLIQRFEFTYEQAWKALYAFMQNEGLSFDSYPKSIFKTAYAHGFIDSEASWLGMIADRNIASHEYCEDKIDDVAHDIRTSYYPQLLKLAQRLSTDNA